MLLKAKLVSSQSLAVKSMYSEDDNDNNNNTFSPSANLSLSLSLAYQ